jgi:hypothetical protein
VGEANQNSWLGLNVQWEIHWENEGVESDGGGIVESNLYTGVQLLCIIGC